LRWKQIRERFVCDDLHHIVNHIVFVRVSTSDAYLHAAYYTGFHIRVAIHGRRRRADDARMTREE
jgi:hypothetical protein